MVSRSSYSPSVTGQDSGSSEKSRLKCEKNWILGEGGKERERTRVSFVVFVASGDVDMLAIYLAICASLAHLCSRLWCPRFDIPEDDHEGSDS